MDPVENEKKKLKDCFDFVNQWVEDYSCLYPDRTTSAIKNEVLLIFQRMYMTETGEFMKAPLEYTERYRPYMQDAQPEKETNAGSADETGPMANVESFDVSESVNNVEPGHYALQICKEPNNIHFSENAAYNEGDKPARLLDKLNNHLFNCHLYVILDEESWQPLEDLRSFCKTEHISLGVSDNFLTPRDTELVSYANKAMNKFIDLWKLKREFIRKREYWKFITIRGGELAILSDFDKSTISELFCEKSMYEKVGDDEILFFKTGIQTLDEKLIRQLR